MKSPLVIILAAIGLYCVFLIANVPATQVIHRITLPDNIQVSGGSGTLWNGKASEIRVNGLPIKKVNWQLSALPILWGSVVLDVSAGNNRDADQIAFSGELKTSLTNTASLSSNDFLLFLPTDQVLANVALPLPVQAGGRFRVIVNQLEFDQHCQQLNANGEWLNAEVAGTQGPIKLGTFSAILGCENQAIIATVSEPNMLGLSLQATLTGMRSIAVTGQFKPDDSLPEEVHQAALFFGKPDSSGYFPINL